MKYDSVMDKPCIYLCNALNAVPGIETNSSCCGHNKSQYRIWFYSSYMRGLFVIARCLDSRYHYMPGWTCSIQGTDRPTRIPVFLLSSEHKGKQAYREANKLAKNIYAFLENKKLMKMYRIKNGEK